MSEIPIQVKITADTDQAIAGIKKVDSAVDAFSKSSKKAASGSNVLTGSFGKFNASALLASNRSRMITQQLSQVAQQSTATGNVMQALAIQAADIGLAFGVAGTIIGALAGLAIPALVTAFSDGTDAGKEFKETLEGLADARTSLEQQLFAAKRGVASQELVTAQFEKQKLIQERQLLVLRAMDETGRTRSKTNKEIVALNEKVLTVGMEELRIRRLLQDLQEDQVRKLNILNGAYVPLTENQRIMADRAREAADSFEEMQGKTEKVRDELGQAAFEALRIAGVDMASPISAAAAEAAKLAATLGIAYAQAAALSGSGTDPGSGKVYSGRGSVVPSKVDSQLAGLGWTAPPKVTARSGGGGGKASRTGLESFISELQTEQEALDLWRVEAMEKLAEANAEELAMLGGHKEAKLRIEQEYQDRVNELRQQEQSQTLSSYGTLFGNLSTTFASGSDKLLKISKAFSVAQGLINSYRAYTEVLADPSLIGRPFLRTALAASTLSAGLAQVANIKSVSSGGGGGGAAAATASAPPTQNVVWDIRNATPDTMQQVSGVVDLINEAGQQGYVLNIQTVAT